MFQLIMPKMGESVAEATILKWLKKEGDRIELDEAVLEIATDKVDSEIPSPVAGTLSKRLFEEGQVVKVGQPVATIDDGGNGTVATPSPAAEKQVSPAAPKASMQSAPAGVKTMEVKPAATQAPSEPSQKFYSPLVRNMAKEEGISITELDTIKGSGMNDRVTKQDLLSYIEARKSGAAMPQTRATTTAPLTGIAAGPNTEIVEMDRMRKLIADHMVMSKHTSPHVTSFVEADVTGIVKWRDRMKSEFEKREGEKITFTPLFIEAIVKAIRDFPMINVSLDGTKIIVKKDIHIGMATALPSGNLIVPVIKNADRLNLAGLAKVVNDLARRARENKLQPDEIQGGTYTLTNVGTFGNVMGTPIINQPQVAIMATGAIRKKPVVIETPEGDVIAIRHMMFLSHSYDHRIVDGALGGSFVRRVADYLEQFDTKRQI